MSEEDQSETMRLWCVYQDADGPTLHDVMLRRQPDGAYEGPSWEDGCRLRWSDGKIGVFPWPSAKPVIGPPWSLERAGEYFWTRSEALAFQVHGMAVRYTKLGKVLVRDQLVTNLDGWIA